MRREMGEGGFCPSAHIEVMAAPLAPPDMPFDLSSLSQCPDSHRGGGAERREEKRREESRREQEREEEEKKQSLMLLLVVFTGCLLSC